MPIELLLYFSDQVRVPILFTLSLLCVCVSYSFTIIIRDYSLSIRKQQKKRKENCPMPRSLPILLFILAHVNACILFSSSLDVVQSMHTHRYYYEDEISIFPHTHTHKTKMSTFQKSASIFRHISMKDLFFTD